MRFRCLALPAALCVLTLCSATQAQTIDDLRDELRENLAESHFAKGLAGQVMATDEIDLAGAHYSMDEGTRLAVLAVPYAHTFRPWDGGTDTDPPTPRGIPGLYVEAAVGYAKAREHTDDAYGGTLPGFETAISSEVMTLSGLVGGGPQFTLAQGLSITPILNASVAYIDNDATYSGPGAAVTAAFADGIAFNWESWVSSVGTAARLEYQRDIGRDYDLKVLARYDLRWTETFASDDTAQEFTARSQIATIRADVTGPIWRGVASDAVGEKKAGQQLRWRATVGYRAFLEGDLYDTKDYIMLGGGLDLTGALPLGGEASVEAGVLWGDDVTGFYAGVGLSF